MHEDDFTDPAEDDANVELLNPEPLLDSKEDKAWSLEHDEILARTTAGYPLQHIVNEPYRRLHPRGLETSFSKEVLDEDSAREIREEVLKIDEGEELTQEQREARSKQNPKFVWNTPETKEAERLTAMEVMFQGWLKSTRTDEERRRLYDTRNADEYEALKEQFIEDAANEKYTAAEMRKWAKTEFERMC